MSAITVWLDNHPNDPCEYDSEGGPRGSSNRRLCPGDLHLSNAHVHAVALVKPCQAPADVRELCKDIWRVGRGNRLIPSAVRSRAATLLHDDLLDDLAFDDDNDGGSEQQRAEHEGLRAAVNSLIHAAKECEEEDLSEMGWNTEVHSCDRDQVARALDLVKEPVVEGTPPANPPRIRKAQKGKEKARAAPDIQENDETYDDAGPELNTPDHYKTHSLAYQQWKGAAARELESAIHAIPNKESRNTLNALFDKAMERMADARQILNEGLASGGIISCVLLLPTRPPFSTPGLPSRLSSSTTLTVSAPPMKKENSRLYTSDMTRFLR
ncbi:hypothetical protein SLS56_011735 [Neofusicoccum ribis]|uniref:Ankyrin repeat protein n=1 Tax=Neofusicoccum ribis TaxID=45134 RepID=A0ABR3SAT6_9PEZI